MFEIVEKDRPVRPPVAFLLLFQLLPQFTGPRFRVEHFFLCLVTEEHLANHRLDPPHTALLSQIDAFKSGVGRLEHRRQRLDLRFVGYQGVDHDISEKGDDSFTGTTGTDLALIAILGAYIFKVLMKKGNTVSDLSEISHELKVPLQSEPVHQYFFCYPREIIV